MIHIPFSIDPIITNHRLSKVIKDIKMNIDDFVGQTITGQQLNDILNGMPVLKFMHNSDIHYGSLALCDWL